MVGGDQKCPSNYFVFKYLNKYIVHKFSIYFFVDEFLMSLIIGFEVGGGGAPFLSLTLLHGF